MHHHRHLLLFFFVCLFGQQAAPVLSASASAPLAAAATVTAPSKPKIAGLTATFQAASPGNGQANARPHNVIQYSSQRPHQAQHYHHHHQPIQHHHQAFAQFAKYPSTVQQPLIPQESHVCQLQNSKCPQDATFNRSAMVDFQRRLQQSSFDLRNLLRTYLDEFRSLSLDLVLVAKNNTLARLLSSLNSPISNEIANSYSMATERLYAGLHMHLNAHDETPEPMEQPSQLAGLSGELSDYFRQLYLIQLKQQLEARRATTGSRFELECLSKNLRTQQQVERALEELVEHSRASPSDQEHQSGRSQLTLDQLKLSQSIKQSLEFARTLLSSLTMADEMFQQLTERTNEWMPHSACHQALAKLTQCPQCYQPPRPTNRTHQQPNLGRILGQSPAAEQVSGAPCENYCLNVVRGCMNDIYELNRFWSDHVAALSRFKINMIQMNNIENVMSSLDERLANFVVKLQQQYSNRTSANTNHNSESSSTAAKMNKLCLKPHSEPAHNLRWALQQKYQIGNPTRLVAIQHQQTTRYGHSTLLARLSPKMSLFNRLDEFVHQLQASRNFFAEWPTRLCQGIRQEASPPSHVHLHSQTSPNEACWNGRDYLGYNKPLIPFGQAITSSHPEISMQQTDPYNKMVLNFVAKLKDTGAKLAHKAARPSSSLYHTFDLDALANMNSQVHHGVESSETKTLALAPSDQGNADQPITPATILTAKIISAVAAKQVGEIQSEDLILDEHTTVAGSDPTEDNSSTASSEDGDGQDDESDEAGSSSDDDGESHEDVPECKTNDCIDLLTTVNSSITDGHGEQQVSSNTIPTSTSGGSSEFELAPSPEVSHQSTYHHSSSQQPHQTYSSPGQTHYPFDPSSPPNNELWQTFTPPDPAIIERPPATASASSAIFDVYNIGAVLLFQALATALVLARRVYKRPQI